MLPLPRGGNVGTPRSATTLPAPVGAPSMRRRSLPDPGRVRMLRDVPVPDAAPAVDHDEHGERAEGERLDREQIGGPDAGRVVAEKRAPRLARGAPQRLLTVAAHGASSRAGSLTIVRSSWQKLKITLTPNGDNDAISEGAKRRTRSVLQSSGAGGRRRRGYANGRRSVVRWLWWIAMPNLTAPQAEVATEDLDPRIAGSASAQWRCAWSRHSRLSVPISRAPP